MFKALYVEKTETGQQVTLRELAEADLPEGDVTIRVQWSSLNYKDALALTGKGPIIRNWPMVPGIDLAGKVEASTHPAVPVGQDVIVTGHGLGENRWGGFAQLARVPGLWALPQPLGLNGRQVMALGTAGFTAMLCVQALQREGVEPASGPVLVTGASGGVGSVAIMLLSRLGYQVVAVTGRLEEQPYLHSLGAADVLPRAHFTTPSRPLEKARWAGAVDVVGGQVLASVCASMRPQGVVTACGLAGGMDFSATVAPFILRGVTLVGIDSVQCPRRERQEAWARLAELINPSQLDDMVREIDLAEAPQAADMLLAGHVRGRLVVRIP